MRKCKLFIPIIFTFTLFVGCQTDQSELISSSNYSEAEYKIISSQLDLPEEVLHYNSIVSESTKEANHKATLGRVLFYDKALSSDGNVSCASCHNQKLAFADNVKLSQGANGNLTKRNSIALGSLRNFGVHYDDSDADRDTPGLFWDERAGSIKEQLKQTINNPHEMDMELSELVSVLEAKDYYNVLFEKAFGQAEINEDYILESIEAFVNSISSTNTKFETALLQDLNYITGDSIVGEINNQEGLSLFTSHCSGCHSNTINHPFEESTPEIINMANNGLEILNEDKGAFMHTLNPSDIGKFKVPGLRNIELTGPYMHDGRFETLEEVVEFYNSDVQMQDNLHPLLKSGNSAKKLNLTESQKQSLVGFLKSLTDTKMISDVKWSDPFQ